MPRNLWEIEHPNKRMKIVLLLNIPPNIKGAIKSATSGKTNN